MTDKQTRERLLAIWMKSGKSALRFYCGGKGLVVGCPICKKRWGK